MINGTDLSTLKIKWTQVNTGPVGWANLGKASVSGNKLAIGGDCHPILLKNGVADKNWRIALRPGNCASDTFNYHGQQDGAVGCAFGGTTDNVIYITGGHRIQKSIDGGATFVATGVVLPGELASNDGDGRHVGNSAMGDLRNPDVYYSACKQFGIKAIVSADMSSAPVGVPQPTLPGGTANFGSVAVDQQSPLVDGRASVVYFSTSGQGIWAVTNSDLANPVKISTGIAAPFTAVYDMEVVANKLWVTVTDPAAPRSPAIDNLWKYDPQASGEKWTNVQTGFAFLYITPVPDTPGHWLAVDYAGDYFITENDFQTLRVCRSNAQSGVWQRCRHNTRPMVTKVYRDKVGGGFSQAKPFFAKEGATLHLYQTIGYGALRTLWSNFATINLPQGSPQEQYPIWNEDSGGEWNMLVGNATREHYNGITNQINQDHGNVLVHKPQDARDYTLEYSPKALTIGTDAHISADGLFGAMSSPKGGPIISYTTNGGKSWIGCTNQPTSNNRFFESVTVIAVAPNTIFAFPCMPSAFGQAGSAIPIPQMTTDRGQTWTPINFKLMNGSTPDYFALCEAVGQGGLSGWHGGFVSFVAPPIRVCQDPVTGRIFAMNVGIGGGNSAPSGTPPRYPGAVEGIYEWIPAQNAFVQQSDINPLAGQGNAGIWRTTLSATGTGQLVWHNNYHYGDNTEAGAQSQVNIKAVAYDIAAKTWRNMTGIWNCKSVKLGLKLRDTDQCGLYSVGWSNAGYGLHYSGDVGLTAPIFIDHVRPPFGGEIVDFDMSKVEKGKGSCSIASRGGAIWELVTEQV